MDSRATQCELTDAASRSPKPDVDPSCEESLTERELALWLDHGVIPQADPSAEQRLTPAELLGRAVLRVRLYWGWSQSDLESRSGVDQTTISRLERGKRPGLYLERLTAILGALMIDDVVFVPRKPLLPATGLELMLHGDPWARAKVLADDRLERARRRGRGTPQSPS